MALSANLIGKRVAILAKGSAILATNVCEQSELIR